MGATIRTALDVRMNRAIPRRILVWISGGALLVAMAVDTLAMWGRQVGVPFVGSIEIVQAAALIAALGGLLVASLEHAHARVNLLLERVPADWRATLKASHEVAAAVLYAALLAGSVWIATDLWNASEESELLHIPYRPLRIAVAITLTLLFLLSFVRLSKKGSH
jgi:TRAP-type C4-dicarboxylate transport system permease small subunit